MQVLVDIAMTTLLWLLVVGNVAAVAFGVLAILAPQALGRVDRAGDRWISSRKAGRALETRIDTDRLFLEHPVASGGLLIAGSALVLVKAGAFFLATTPASGARLLAELVPLARPTQSVWEVVWLSLGGVVLLGAAAGVVLGVLALGRSDFLARLNAAASRYYSSRAWMRPAETAHAGIDRALLEHPRLWGAVVALFGLFVLAALLPRI